MAIEMNLSRAQTQNKYPLPTAYARILRVQIDTSARDQVILDVAVYADREARLTDGSLSVDKRRITGSLSALVSATMSAEEAMELTGPGIIRAGYHLLKAQGWAGKDV